MAQRVLMSVFSVAVVAVVARYLGTEHYGLLVLLLSYNALLLQLSSLGLRPYSVRKIAARPEDAREVVEEMLTLRFVLTAVAAAGAVVYLHFGEESLPDALILVLALQLMTNATANCFTPIE